MNKDSERQSVYADDDNELISDIMEFASFINFGDDDLNLDLDLGDTTASYATETPEPVGKDEVNSSGTFETRNNKEDSYKQKETQSYSAAGEATTYGDERQGQLHTFEQDGSEINDN